MAQFRRAAVLVLMTISFQSACTPEEVAVWREAGERQALDQHRARHALTDAQLGRLANCESGGNPRAVSPSGSYHGLYQFNQRTWNGAASAVMPSYVGVSPSAAPAYVQDAMARELYTARGRQPWPVCGKRI
jgi:hypothetical protein